MRMPCTRCRSSARHHKRDPTHLTESGCGRREADCPPDEGKTETARANCTGSSINSGKTLVSSFCPPFLLFGLEIGYQGGIIEGRHCYSIAFSSGAGRLPVVDKLAAFIA